MKIITTKNLSKEYILTSGSVLVLDKICLSIEEGEFIGIVGPSGSGKTTLMGILGGLLQQTSGNVKINGLNLETLNSEELAKFRLRNIGFIFQSNFLIPSLTAKENIEVPLILSKMKPDQREKISFQRAKEVGLENKIDHLQEELSGGECQRVGIARSLVNNPKIILADEPTGSLDSMSGSEIISLLKTLCKEKNITVLIVSHNPSYYKEYDRILRLENGKLNNFELSDKEE